MALPLGVCRQGFIYLRFILKTTSLKVCETKKSVLKAKDPESIQELASIAIGLAAPLVIQMYIRIQMRSGQL